MTESKLYHYTAEMYQYLIKHASEDKDTKELLYKGTLKAAFLSTGASTRWYTPIRSLLGSPDEDPCITIIKRGSGDNPSVVRLNHPPPEGWSEITNKDLTGGRESATLTAEIERGLRSLMAWRETFGEVNLKEALADHERRLISLEAKREGSNGKTKSKSKNTNTN